MRRRAMWRLGTQAFKSQKVSFWFFLFLFPRDHLPTPQKKLIKLLLHTAATTRFLGGVGKWSGGIKKYFFKEPK
jgi:hypothetical protein